MSNGTKDDSYMLGRAPAETARLNNQHKLVTKCFGYDLNPDIFKVLKPNARIADIATGTAAWLEAVSRKLPSTCELHGFDVSADQFPPEKELPPNVKLHLQDVKKPFPIEWHGMFDAIHIRFITAVMHDDEWEPVMNNIYNLLKPGGAIQWVEPDPISAFPPLRTYTAPRPKNLYAMSKKWYDKTHFGSIKTPGCKMLPDMFRKAGMVDVYEDVVGSDADDEVRHAMGKNIIDLVYNSLKVFGDEGDEDPWSAEKLDQMRDKSIEETDAGGYCRFNIHTAVGFKPS